MIYHLAKMAGVKFTAYHNHTTVDPPELIYFMRKYYPDLVIIYPEKTMWQLIVHKQFPMTRLIRYCCAILKESGGNGEFVVTGVRWAESAKRKKQRGVLELNTYTKQHQVIMLNSDNDESRRLIESCTMKSKHMINPIIDWEDSDVWNFITSNKLPYCCLYDEGYHRLGCIGCPLSGTNGMLKDFARYPKYYSAYLRTFDRMLNARHESGKETYFTSAKDVMDWWIYCPPKIIVDEDQLTLDSYQ